jgi:hypothetical protein
MRSFDALYDQNCLSPLLEVLDSYAYPLLFLVVGIGANPVFNSQEHNNKSITTVPFGNTCEADEVSLEVEARVVARLRCLQP